MLPKADNYALNMKHANNCQCSRILCNTQPTSYSKIALNLLSTRIVLIQYRFLHTHVHSSSASLARTSPIGTGKEDPWRSPSVSLLPQAMLSSSVGTWPVSLLDITITSFPQLFPIRSPSFSLNSWRYVCWLIVCCKLPRNTKQARKLRGFVPSDCWSLCYCSVS